MADVLAELSSAEQLSAATARDQPSFVGAASARSSSPGGAWAASAAPPGMVSTTEVEPAAEFGPDAPPSGHGRDGMASSAWAETEVLEEW